MMTRVACSPLFLSLCLVTLAFAELPGGYVFPAEPPGTFSDFAKETDAYLAWLESRGFNGVVLIAHEGKVLLHKAYGMADREAGRKMATATAFDIGSIVKPMNKAAMIKLESEGKLSLSDPISKYFDNVPSDKAEINLQMVIDHKAGFPDIFGDDYEPAGRDEVMNKLMAAPLISKPGEKYNYSNVGYSLLATVIEKVTGRPYERYMVEEVIKPSGVKRIGYQIPAWKNEELAVGYAEGKRWGTPLDHKWMEDGPSWNLRGNGGMLCTVEELYQWFDAALSGRVLSEKATEKYRQQSFREGKIAKRVMGPAGGNGVFNVVYVNVDDFKLVFVIATSVDAMAGEDVFKVLRDRLPKVAKSDPS